MGHVLYRALVNAQCMRMRDNYGVQFVCVCVPSLYLLIKQIASFMLDFQLDKRGLFRIRSSTPFSHFSCNMQLVHMRSYMYK